MQNSPAYSGSYPFTNSVSKFAVAVALFTEDLNVWESNLKLAVAVATCFLTSTP
ncbi:Hypothetical predicted protein, partial [Olea europaea subsp. europaea]